jgi:hypothetical protein
MPNETVFRSVAAVSIDWQGGLVHSPRRVNQYPDSEGWLSGLRQPIPNRTGSRQRWPPRVRILLPPPGPFFGGSVREAGPYTLSLIPPCGRGTGTICIQSVRQCRFANPTMHPRRGLWGLLQRCIRRRRDGPRQATFRSSLLNWFVVTSRRTVP